MSDTPTKYNVWLHIEGVNEDDDVIEGDEHHEPHKIGQFGTAQEAQEHVWLIEQLLEQNEREHFFPHPIPSIPRDLLRVRMGGGPEGDQEGYGTVPDCREAEEWEQAMSPAQPLRWITNHPKSLKGLWPRRAGVEYVEGSPAPTGRYTSEELTSQGMVGVYVRMPDHQYRNLPICRTPEELKKHNES